MGEMKMLGTESELRGDMRQVSSPVHAARVHVGFMSRK